MKHDLALYYYDQCPFCQIVLHKINELGLKSIELRNTLQNKEHNDKLIKDTGRRTVPCLYIDNKPMHESNDIVNWLENHKEKLS